MFKNKVGYVDQLNKLWASLGYIRRHKELKTNSVMIKYSRARLPLLNGIWILCQMATEKLAHCYNNCLFT